MEIETYRTLWNNIQQFQLDDPAATIKFSDKLASENKWSIDFASRAIAEYKKFIFLCCISPTGASPSPIVDQVWHLHLTYTHNYWKEFCATTLGKEIHHHPSKGGISEKEKHHLWYAQTLDFYNEVFNESAPTDIWPQPKRKTSFQSELSGLPELNFSSVYKKNLHLLLIPFLLPFLFGKLHPFALTGPEFLFFYGLLLAAGIVFLLNCRKRKRELIADAINTTPVKEANVFAVARFVYGKNKAIETAIVDLVAKEIVVVEKQNCFSFYPSKVDADTLARNPLAANLLHHSKADSTLRLEDMTSFYNEDMTYHDGLATLFQRINKKDYFGFIIAFIIVLIGLLRINQGISNHYPVTYLQMMTMIGGLILAGFAATLSTHVLYRNIFIDRHHKNELSISTPEPLLSKFVFLGVAALAGTYAFANLESTLKNNRYSDGSGGYADSSGCGSSCGGGGCGGCGGGD